MDKIEIFVNGRYKCTVTKSRTPKEAVENWLKENNGYTPEQVKAFYKD